MYRPTIWLSTCGYRRCCFWRLQGDAAWLWSWPCAFWAETAPPTESIGVELELYGTKVCLRAALDTGCHLKDPITCLPVLLVSYPDAETRLPMPVRAFLDDWFGGSTPTDPPEGLALRLIPCTTAEQSTLLPGFATGRIGLISPRGIQLLDRTAVAFSRQSFGSEKYEALYGPDFL